MPVEKLAGLYDVPWAQLQDAYGSAADCRKADSDQRQEWVDRRHIAVTQHSTRPRAKIVIRTEQFFGQDDEQNLRLVKKTLVKIVIGALGMTVCIAFFPASWAGDFTAKPTFKVGDPAPALEPISWIQGTPLTKYEPGHVYVVEFWATWCPPCIKAIPHLSALQKKYPDTLTVVGVNVEALLEHEPKADAVPAFLKKWGKDMAYALAMDDPAKKTISDAWITASGSLGIPTACIIDSQGKLVWVGYPDLVQSYAFDQALQDTLAGKVDLARARALQAVTIRETATYWAKLNKPNNIQQSN